MTRFLLTATTSIALGLCVTSIGYAANGASLDSLVRTSKQHKTPQTPSRINQLAMVSLPPYRFKAVNGTTEDGGFQQTIELEHSVSGLQRNAVDIRYRRATSETEPQLMAKPTEAGIRDELASRFPNMQMVVVEQPRRNSYGVYGLAVGKWANGTSCIYAWQWADNDDTRAASDAFDSMSLRISLCRAGTTLDGLALIVDGLRLGPFPVQTIPGYLQQPPSRIVARPARARDARARMTTPSETTRNHSSMTLAQSEIPQHPRVEKTTVGAADSGLDPSLPAAAYLGPKAKASTQ